MLRDHQFKLDNGHWSVSTLLLDWVTNQRKLSRTDVEIASQLDRVKSVLNLPAEIISEDPATVQVSIAVPFERVVNCVIGALENGYSPWLHSFNPVLPDSDAAMNGSFDEKDLCIWYAREKFWELGGTARAVFDEPTDDEGDGSGEVILDRAALLAGLTLMAEKSPRHFSDLLQENDDADTHDVFMQYVILKDVVYG